MTEQVPLSGLVEDLAIYPRGAVSHVHVDDLVYAIDAGAQLPPVVADRATLKIVDGFHRRRAWMKRLGDHGIIEADLRDYADDAEMLLESARLNSPHGLPLGRYDQVQVHIKAQRLGVPDEEIAQALGVTPARLAKITLREAKSDGGPVGLKGGMGHLSGNYLTAEQVAEIRRQRGAPARLKAVELARLLRAQLAPVAQDPDLRLALSDLAGAIADTLAPYGE